LQDLIYKRGQAGVNRAIVSIVFNNEEPTKSPVGFQDSKQIVVTRQVVMGGKNKYLINGVNVTQQRVENLFQSVQLNVNHPHFLIMQGRITKVLNMKPEETLALIEETAGTRMYEEKKNKASQTLQKKELKVKEISDLLDENIIPRLNKLRLERKEYLEYQVVQSEAQQLEKACIAYDYHQKTLKSEQLDKDLEENMNQVTEIQNNVEMAKDEAETVSTDIEAKKLLKKKSVSSISLVESETKLNEASNALVVAESQLEIQEKQLAETQKACAGFEHELEQIGGHQHVNNKDLEIQLNQKMELLQEKKAELLKLEELYDSLLTGIAKSGNQLGYAKLIEEEKKMIRDDMVEKERINMNISSLESELSKSLQHVPKWELKYKEFQHDIQSQEKAIDSLKHELNRMRLDSSVERELISNREALRRDIEQLQWV
jgi:structural maintenance of chromosome 2